MRLASDTSWRFVLDLYSQTNECLAGDIIPGDWNDVVWGALYELDRELVLRADGERSALDAIEGHMPNVDAENYWPMCATVALEGEANRRVHAWTYVGHPEARLRVPAAARPSENYLDRVLVGAAEIGLPLEYREQLRVAVQVAQKR